MTNGGKINLIFAFQNTVVFTTESYQKVKKVSFVSVIGYVIYRDYFLQIS